MIGEDVEVVASLGRERGDCSQQGSKYRSGAKPRHTAKCREEQIETDNEAKKSLDWR